jgi:hypothetical protein
LVDTSAYEVLSGIYLLGTLPGFMGTASCAGDNALGHSVYT